MSGYTEECKCPKCGGELFHVSTSTIPDENYGYCLECGHSYAMTETTWSLEDINEERKEWELEPLTELKPQTQ